MTKRIPGTVRPIRPSTRALPARLYRCVRGAMPKALRTAVWILKITLPVSLAVSILNHYGLVELVTQHLTPAFTLIGLRGEAALPFVTGMLLNIYSVIAVLSQLSLNLREITIVAVMSLTAHNLIIETAIQRKTGSRAWHMVALRLGAAFAAAAILNLALPDMGQRPLLLPSVPAASTLPELLHGWVISSFGLTLKIVLLVTLLMVLQKGLQEFGLIGWLAGPLAPMLKLMGLPRSTTFLWIVANLLGLAYGSAAMLEEVDEGRVTRQEADLLNYHVAISHSNLEDLLLFAAVGVSAFWLLIPRLAIAIAAVWGRRLFTEPG